VVHAAASVLPTTQPNQPGISAPEGSFPNLQMFCSTAKYVLVRSLLTRLCAKVLQLLGSFQISQLNFKCNYVFLPLRMVHAAG